VPAWEKGRDASPARVEYDVGDKALHAGSVTPIFRDILRRAFTGGAFGHLDPTVFEAKLKQISAHSTRVGINQDYFASGENLAGIMDALRWKSRCMPLLYNRNLADDARLDTLVLTMPIFWKGTLAQYVGRLHRQHTGKTNVWTVD
jgi:hypothetical protein